MTRSTRPPTRHLVWFKRDLRVADHAPLTRALAAGGPVAALYVIEPAVVGAADFAGRHWAAIAEALAELREALAGIGVPLAIVRGEVVPNLERLRAAAEREESQLGLWSHEETGNAITYARDVAVGEWARACGVAWTEIPQFGVVRRLARRDGWAARWEQRMQEPVLPEPTPQSAAFGAEACAWLGTLSVETEAPTAAALGLAPDPCPGRQSATRVAGLERLLSFLAYRGANYNKEMSSPRTATAACSRLSVPLAYGTVSLREVVQAAAGRAEELREQRAAGAPSDYRLGALRAFNARLHWHCHFIQKLESEPRVEFEAFVPALDALREGGDPAERAERLAAWAEGRTGYPFIDACMRCLRETGWINFRMRAMLMSFASYDLWLPWRDSGLVLARCFTDYEPGIHWPQVQMQSGTTGINTLRMYSPVKQSRDQDPDGEFIRRWVPELADVTDDRIHEPWRVAGHSYPRPVVDHAEAVKAARTKFSALRRSEGFREQARAVFEKHGSRKRPGTEIVDPRWFEQRSKRAEREAVQLGLALGD